MVVVAVAARAEGVLDHGHTAGQLRALDEPEVGIERLAITGLVYDSDGIFGVCRKRSNLAEMANRFLFRTGLREELAAGCIASRRFLRG